MNLFWYPKSTDSVTVICYTLHLLPVIIKSDITMRNLLLIATIWLLYIVIRQSLNQAKARREQKQSSAPKPQDKIVASTIKCEHCGVYIPKQEAVKSDNEFYCSQHHAQLGKSR
ncbi:hypothetical protein MNBD_GAMMA12-1698 [hydrothermal vent metagenome]|uniref:Pyrimidine deaminase n=1 Tax=hydrothermal vent metagenome TaxID=652676 RepID=A0A3B0YTU0_9ZZZZ